MPPRKGNAGSKRRRLEAAKAGESTAPQPDTVDVKTASSPCCYALRAELEATRLELKKAQSKLKDIGEAITCIVTHAPMTHPVCLKNCGHVVDRSALSSMEIVAIQTARDKKRSLEDVAVECPKCREETEGTIKSHPTCYPMRNIAEILFPDLSYDEKDPTDLLDGITVPAEKGVTEAEVAEVLRPFISKLDIEMKATDTWVEFVINRILLPKILTSLKEGNRDTGFVTPATIRLQLVGNVDPSRRDVLGAKLKSLCPSAYVGWQSYPEGTRTGIVIDNITYRDFLVAYDARVAENKTRLAYAIVTATVSAPASASAAASASGAGVCHCSHAKSATSPS